MSSHLLYESQALNYPLVQVDQFGLGVYWGVALKARPRHKPGSAQKQRNRKHSAIRSRVEHLFRIIECQFGYTKTRYKGLVKNAAQVFMLIGLANIYLQRKALLA